MRMMFFLCCALSLSGNGSAKTAYINFNWVNPQQQKVIANSTLLEDKGHIIDIGHHIKIDKDVSVVDLKGKYVIPGFIDTHTHVTLGAISVQTVDGDVKLVANNSDEIAQRNGKVLLAHGITDIRNPGGDGKKSVRYKYNVKKDSWIGPDAYVAAELLDKMAFEGLSVAVSEAEEINQAIKQQKELGVDFVKLYASLDADLLKVAIDSAHEHGLKAVAHLDQIAWDDAAIMGLDATVHAMPISADLLSSEVREDYLKTHRPGAFAFFEWYEAVNFDSARFQRFLTTIVDKGLQLDPTLIAFHNAFWGDTDEVKKHPQLHFAHPELVNNWQTFFTFTVGWQAEDFARAKAVWPKIQQFIRILHERGAFMTVGTDMNNPWVIPGVSFHQEMKLLVDSGLPIFDVLEMATLNGAIAINQKNKKGSLSKGKLANFVILDKDPSVDIANTQSIHAVVKKGVWYAPKVLLKDMEQ